MRLFSDQVETEALAESVAKLATGNVIEEDDFLSLFFRTISGANNNLLNPEWGSAGDILIRLADNDYEDGVSEPAGANRPSARVVSNGVVAQSESIKNDANFSDYIWQWGQFIDHDLDLTDPDPSNESFPISVPSGDPFFDPFNTGMQFIPLTRSLFKVESGVRQQENEISAFIDASMVYGSDRERALELRTLDGTGRLKVSSGNLLPFNTNGLPNAGGTGSNFFLAGDVRANEQVGLAAMHTLFVREHNYVAKRIKRIFPFLHGDSIYELSRMVVGAEIQAITYREFLPRVLGQNSLSQYSGYRSNVNPGIANEFSTAAYRFGHSMLSPTLLRLDQNNEVITDGNLALKDAFFDPSRILDEGGIEPILRGLSKQAAQKVDTQIVDGVRNFLFGPPGSGGFDLASLNIQRGRDHGLSSYNDTRAALGLGRVSSFAQISSDANVQAKLASVYASVDDVDLWVGGLAEDAVNGSILGETFFTIVRDQFSRLRDGDRFWYERHLSSPELVEWVNSQTLSTIIRRNTSINDELQAEAFDAPMTVNEPDPEVDNEICFDFGSFRICIDPDDIHI